MAIYDSIDADFSFDGDYDIGSDGDIKDTSSDYLKSLTNEIHSIMKSEIGDWEKHPLYATDLTEEVGKPNNQITGRSIEQKVRSALISNNIVKSQDLAVRVVPVGLNQVLILLNISVQATPQNGLNPGQTLSVALSYDTLESTVFFLPSNQTKLAFNNI